MLGTAVLATTAARGALAQWLDMCPADARAPSDALQSYLRKMRNFNKPSAGDVILRGADRRLLHVCAKRLERLQRVAGHGNFQLLCFDDALSIARHYSEVGTFPPAELQFLERIFYTDATIYGFMGDKTLKSLTARIPTKEVVKIPHSGNYLYKGRPLDTYERIKCDVGHKVILTSGVRGVMKQFLLFLRKADDNRGNLSLASRSLAPPGFSFHGICDFDLGQVGLGLDNFTARFATTEVYADLKRLDYIDLRYPQDNLLGVRFEPWHIKMNWRA